MKIQIRNFQFFSVFFLALATLFITSCERANLIDVDSFTDGAIEHLQGNSIGKAHCLELIFPVTLVFVDETTAEVNSYEEMHEAIVTFFEESGLEKNKENRPTFAFPIQVLNKEGEIIDVASQDEFRALRKECPKRGKCKGRKGRGFDCFSLVFPVTVNIGGEEATYETKEALKEAIKAYKEEAGPDAERPNLVFPITIQYEDESTTEVQSKEELIALKEACQEE